MSIGMDTMCLECQLRRNLQTARQLGSEEQAVDFVRDWMRMYLSAPREVSSLWFSPHTSRLLHEHYGIPEDRFAKEREDSNRFVLERMELLYQQINAAEDPVRVGLRLAIVGNYLDFSALQGQVSFETFSEMLQEAHTMELDEAVYEKFLTELQQGSKLLYLTDNAGEIGFDRIFAEALHQRFPHLQITFCVRGGPALNDATREDAAAVGIPFPVIDNGNQVPGTWLDLLSPEAKQAMEEADVIFAKGMANAETLMGCGYHIYYAFLVKCQRFVNLLKLPLMTPVLAAERKD